MRRPILKRGDPRLLKRSAPVTNIATAKELIQDLWDTLKAVQSLYEFKRGSGLSAPQIGELSRISVVEYGDRAWTMVNPKIIGHSDELMTIREGCLSFFDYRGNTQRFQRVVVEAIDEHGNHLSIKAEGDFAMLLQHEIDHLDGILCDQRLASDEQLVKVEGMPQIP